MADLLPPSRAGRFWGGRQRLLSIVVFLAALSYGAILDATAHSPYRLLGFTIVFAIAATFGIADIVVHMGVAEPAPHPSEPGQSPGAASPFR